MVYRLHRSTRRTHITRRPDSTLLDRYRGQSRDYGIQIKNNWFQTLLNKVSFGHIYNDTNLEVKIRANDAKAGIETSGVDKYYYYIDKITDPSGEINAKTVEELDALRNGRKFYRSGS